MKYIAVILAVTLALGIFANYGGSHLGSKSCLNGVAKAYATIQFDPPYLVGTIPSKYTGEEKYFTVRYNCRQGSVQVRRVDLGTYDVRFPGLVLETAMVTPVSDEGDFASVAVINHNEFRVILRGPLSAANVNIRRDIAFSIVVY